MIEKMSKRITKRTSLVLFWFLALHVSDLLAQKTDTESSMGKPNAVPQENAWKLDEAQKDQYLRAMQEHSLELHDLSNRILAEQDAEKRQALKDRQLQLMKEYRFRLMGRLQNLREQNEQRR